MVQGQRLAIGKSDKLFSAMGLRNPLDIKIVSWPIDTKMMMMYNLHHDKDSDTTS